MEIVNPPIQRAQPCTNVSGVDILRAAVLTACNLATYARLSANDYIEMFLMSEASGPETLKGTTQNHRFGLAWQTA